VGGEWATGQTFIGETFPAKLRGRYGSLMQTGAPLGILLASLVEGFLAPNIGWRESFFISIVPAFLVIYIRKGLPESDVWLEKAKSRSEKFSKGFSSVKSQLEDVISIKNRRMFLLALVSAILGLSAYWFTYSWLPDYSYPERHFSLTKSALWIVITQIGGLIGYLSFGFVADRLAVDPLSPYIQASWPWDW
jgi:MFS family permease